MKRLTYLIVPVLVIVGVIVVGYLTRYKPGGSSFGLGGGGGKLPAASPPNIPPGSGGGSGTGGAGGQAGQYLGQKFGVVAQVPAVDYFVDAQNNLTVVEPTGQIVKITPTGEQTTLSPSLITGLIKASFSYDGKKVLAVFGASQSPQASIFDVLNKAWQPLPENTFFPSWSPSDYQIAYFNQKTTGAVLTTLNTADAKAKAVEWLTLKEEEMIPVWTSSSEILLTERSSAATQSSLWNFDLKKKTLSPVAVNQAGLESNWSGAADQGVVFISNKGLGGSMKLVDAQGVVLQNFSVLTFPSKCAFDKKAGSPQPPAQTTSTKAGTSTVAAAPATPLVLDCAIPRDSDRMKLFSLPDAYNKKDLLTDDDFYQIDLATGATKQIYSDASQKVDATNLKVFNNTIFFVNRFSQKIYALSLK